MEKATPYQLNVQLKSAHGFVDWGICVFICAALDIRGQFCDLILNDVCADAGNWFSQGTSIGIFRTG